MCATSAKRLIIWKCLKVNVFNDPKITSNNLTNYSTCMQYTILHENIFCYINNCQIWPRTYNLIDFSVEQLKLMITWRKYSNICQMKRPTVAFWLWFIGQMLLVPNYLCPKIFFHLDKTKFFTFVPIYALCIYNPVVKVRMGSELKKYSTYISFRFLK